jgi:hypothetical protein
MPTVHARAIKRAAEICGEHELAIFLGVTHQQLLVWMQGAAIPSEAVFLRIVDILSERTAQELKKQKPGRPLDYSDTDEPPA